MLACQRLVVASPSMKFIEMIEPLFEIEKYYVDPYKYFRLNLKGHDFNDIFDFQYQQFISLAGTTPMSHPILLCDMFIVNGPNKTKQLALFGIFGNFEKCASLSLPVIDVANSETIDPFKDALLLAKLNNGVISLVKELVHSFFKDILRPFSPLFNPFEPEEESNHA
jgi:hypothetical protein